MSSSLGVIHSNLLEYTKRSIGSDVERWLAAPNPETNFQSGKDQREPGTGQWLVESETYLRWKSSVTRHLWLHGKAGSGKSIMSASIIEDVLSHCENNAEIGCAFFYFTFSDSSKQSYIDCLRSVVHQLSMHPSISSALEVLYKSSKRSSVTEETLHKILFDGIRSHKRFFLVLDALDESPETDSNNTRQREKLLEWLQDLSVKLPMLQILATSRRLPDIEAELTEMNFHSESMITASVNVDISKYVVNQLNQDRNLRELNTGIKKKIEEGFLEKADGM